MQNLDDIIMLFNGSDDRGAAGRNVSDVQKKVLPSVRGEKTLKDKMQSLNLSPVRKQTVKCLSPIKIVSFFFIEFNYKYLIS